MTAPAPNASAPTPHDGAYKQLFSHPEMVEQLLRGFVQESWVQRLDYARLERVNASYVSEELLQRSNDIVWRVPLRRCDESAAGEEPQWLYLYLLLEFQSRSDPWMALRLLTYLCLLYQDLVRNAQLTPARKLPPVFPIVLYNGASAWNAERQLSELIDAPAGLAAWKPGFRYQLLDETRVEPQQLEHLRDNLVAQLVRLESWPGPEALTQTVAQLGQLLERHPGLRRAFTVFIQRVVLRKLAPDQQVPDFNDLQEIETMLAENAVPWSVRFRQEGHREGRQEGEAAVLLRQLLRRFGPLGAATVERVQKASPAELEQWADNILDAGSLAEVFGDPD